MTIRGGCCQPQVEKFCWSVKRTSRAEESGLGDYLAAAGHRASECELLCTLRGSPETVKLTTERAKPCFDRLSTNGKSLTISVPNPFALSLSKGEQRRSRPL